MEFKETKIKVDINAMAADNFSKESFDFETVLSRRLELIGEVLSAKASEYADSDNRFHNFDVAARLDNETSERALWGMLKKHIVSVMDMINNCEKHKYTQEHIEEKIGDTVNYLILLEGMLKRRYNL